MTAVVDIWSCIPISSRSSGLLALCRSEGNFADYEADKKRRLGDAAVEPHRIKFKRFER
ncbi:MAG: hypothetical protein NW217_10950 [Hyphomicrobiaceae bacterium]|nr:hypothetical protein [Hyphomicrobiaceae bacterium]